MAASTIKAKTLYRKYGSYSNITIPSSEYIKIDSFANLGVESSHYCIAMMIRGWSGSIAGVTVVKSQTGADFYLCGPAGKTISSFYVEYVFATF